MFVSILSFGNIYGFPALFFLISCLIHLTPILTLGYKEQVSSRNLVEDTSLDVSPLEIDQSRMYQQDDIFASATRAIDSSSLTPKNQLRSGKSVSNNKRRNSTVEAANNKRKPTVKHIVHPSLHAAWDEYSRICLLAKFQAIFTIKYETSSGTKQLIDKMPFNARSKGRCDQFDDQPVLDVLWKESQLATRYSTNSTGGFTFRIIFEKYPDEGAWGVQQMQLLYHTGHPVFRGAVSPSKYIVKSNKNDLRLHFRTRLYESVLCPSPPPIQMYDTNGYPRVIARLTNMQLQAYDFKDPSTFGVFSRCEQVSFGSGVAHPLTPYTIRNDSVTFAIGIMTVSIAILSVFGYAFYRSRVIKSSNYKIVT